jgi:hypothetical protein
MSSTKLSLKFNKDNFSDFVSKLQDLSQIEDVIKLKIDSDKILMYSVLSNEASILALKNFTVNTIEYIENFNKEETYDFIITSAVKFVKNLKFFNSDIPIKLDLVSKKDSDDDSILHVRSAQFSNGKLKISCIGGEQFKIKDISSEVIESRLNPKMAKWSFKMSKEDFSSVKKLSSINNEDRILNISVLNGKVYLNEVSKWELEVDEVDIKNEQLTFIKKYLSNINDNNDYINFSIFPSFILIKDNNSNLMLSFETDFSDDED